MAPTPWAAAGKTNPTTIDDTRSNVSGSLRRMGSLLGSELSKIVVDAEFDQPAALDSTHHSVRGTQLCGTCGHGRLIGQVVNIEPWRHLPGPCGCPEPDAHIERRNIGQPCIASRRDDHGLRALS